MSDPLLRRFVETADETEAERELNVLIEQHALPLAKAIVGRKFRSYAEDRPGRSAFADRDDIVADAMAALVERLHASRQGAAGSAIDNFVSYAAVVIHSACAHHIRRRYPERARLKHRLRYVFSVERTLALWMTDRNELVCGLAEWRGQSIDPAREGTHRGLVERAGADWAGMNRVELTAAITELVVAVGGPIDFEALVGAAAFAAGIAEPRDRCEPSVLRSPEPAQDILIDQRRFLARVWGEVGNLPVRQRIALLLNLRDEAGAGLLWLLPIAGVATIRQIARVLEIPDADFARLWSDIPLDDATIGQRLECTRQQVINLRMAARKRLINHLGGLPAGAARGNILPISASLKDKA